MKRKWIALLTCAVLLCSMLSVSAVLAEGEKPATPTDVETVYVVAIYMDGATPEYIGDVPLTYSETGVPSFSVKNVEDLFALKERTIDVKRYDYNYGKTKDVAGEYLGCTPAVAEGVPMIRLYDAPKDQNLHVVFVLSEAAKKEDADKATSEPTEVPNAEPTAEPEADSTEEPATDPTEEPTTEPTDEPATDSTEEPSVDSTEVPSTESTEEPTNEPTVDPTEEPTTEPTEEPTTEPTVEPTAEPTAELTEEPTTEPTVVPTVEPTTEPTEEPTTEPTVEPTEEPTAEPTEEPTVEPTAEPTAEPTRAPLTVKVEIVNQKDVYYYGDNFTMRAVVENAISAVTYQWEVLLPGMEEWQAVEGAVEETYTFVITEENAQNQYRVKVVETEEQGE